MKKILITGANSYIGTSVEKYLNNFNDSYHINTLDMKESNWVNHDFSSYDVVFHVAGIAHIKETKANKELYFRINRDLVIEVASKAKKDGVKQFIFLSSMSVYGINKGIINKDTEIKPKNAYGLSKYEAELEINKLVDSNFNVVILRPPMVYGYKSPGNYSKLSKLSKKLPFYPKYKNKRSMIFAGNLAIYIKYYIDNNLNGLFFPQNNEYVVTTNLIDTIRVINNKKVRSTRIFNLGVRLMMLVFSPISKIFGSLTYDSNLDNIKLQLVDFNESIRISELGYKEDVL